MISTVAQLEVQKHVHETTTFLMKYIQLTYLPSIK